MAITGPWFITRSALEDYGRLTGGRQAPRSELEREIATAHFVKTNDDGSVKSGVVASRSACGSSCASALAWAAMPRSSCESRAIIALAPRRVCGEW
jgi:hypothetical protein